MEQFSTLVFPEEFYKAEEREGFYINETMKRYWACLLDMMTVIDRVCKKYNLTYYAAYGTMLGTVRHKGFIPWDDDIDLMMKRPDYERLMEVLPGELPKGWWLSNAFNDPGHRQFFAGVSNGDEINLSKEHLSLYHQCPFVAVLDIFPLDYLPRDPKEAEIVKNLFVVIWKAVEVVTKEGVSQKEIDAALGNVKTYCGVDVDRSKPLRSELWKLANQLVMSYREDEGDYLVQWISYINRKCEYKFEKSWLDTVEYHPYENIMMPLPGGYGEILKLTYGDWTIRRQFSGGHDYPSFKKQLEFLKRKVAEMKAQAGEKS